MKQLEQISERTSKREWEGHKRQTKSNLGRYGTRMVKKTRREMQKSRRVSFSMIINKE